MNDIKTKGKFKVRQSHFPVYVFVKIFFTLLAMAAVHAWIINEINEMDMVGWMRPTIVILYWIIVSIGFTFFTRNEIKKNYEKPMKDLAKATDAVSHGDFSVYVSPIHTPERLDYLDVMIMNFNLMVEELGSIETLKTDFFSNVSHEIKTPLAVIQNYAEYLQTANITEEERREYVNTIVESSKKLSKLITNILKLNKIEKQGSSIVREEFDLCQQLCECALKFESIWEEKGIEFNANIEDKAIIEGDADLLEIVWNNILGNAIKFSELGGCVNLTQRSEAEIITVEISDNGCGMSKETINHIFDKFYQGDTSHYTEGNGLGLALVYKIIQLEDGTIEVNSKLGVGTKVIVSIPVRKAIK